MKIYFVLAFNINRTWKCCALKVCVKNWKLYNMQKFYHFIISIEVVGVYIQFESNMTIKWKMQQKCSFWKILFARNFPRVIGSIRATKPFLSVTFDDFYFIVVELKFAEAKHLYNDFTLLYWQHTWNMNDDECGVWYCGINGSLGVSSV